MPNAPPFGVEQESNARGIVDWNRLTHNRFSGILLHGRIFTMLSRA